MYKTNVSLPSFTRGRRVLVGLMQWIPISSIDKRLENNGLRR